MAELRVLFCSPEVSPYAKTGGLADVSASLPPALKDLGCDVRVFMPLYRCSHDKTPLVPLAENLPVRVGTQTYHVHFWRSDSPSGVPIYFLEKDEFFDRTHLYGTPTRGDYEDNADRFVTYCRAVHSLCLQLDWFPDVFHLHDWQSALVAPYQQVHWRYDPSFSHAAVVFTIHNLAYQGIMPARQFALTRLPSEVFTIGGMEFWGQCNLLKAGLVYSDFITTVSPRYSREIQEPQFGHGLDGVLRERRDRLVGILNGIDYNQWDPATDPLIPRRYSSRDLEGKGECKRVLCSELGFPEENLDKPLLAIIGRLTAQKGFDLLLAVLDELLVFSTSLVILGTGDPDLEDRLKEYAGNHPGQVRAIFQFDECMAHRIEAGADVFLMPSRFEPCGLNQMYSLRYGTVPVVHATGGLDDSVVDVLRDPEGGTGFKFYEYTPEAFMGSIRAALELYAHKERWAALQRRGMAQDFSWNRSAGQYVEVYRRALERKQRF
ncbi:MAG: glycogen synthase GlgA [Syntrophobacteraceae bacterium]|nr:glycogen synthase GlgA [Syntrophobacteraceae bacterium]